MEYRERNGHVDRMSAHQTKCPNCGSSRYVTRISKEYCPDCKIECDYWAVAQTTLGKTMKKISGIAISLKEKKLIVNGMRRMRGE